MKGRASARKRQPPTNRPAFTLYGAARRLQDCRDNEVMIAGPSETGKTVSCLQYLNNLAWQYPGMQGAIVRKQMVDMHGSVLQSFQQKILGADSPVRIYGGAHAEWYDYPNGSRIWVGGMDKPGKVLSSERDIIYVNQAEELTLADWETLTTRVTGRAANMPFSQLIGDCNPGGAKHWIKQRETITLLESRHEDNPTLFDPATHQITERGKRTMATLDKLTGVRKERLRFGRWVNVEGAVYEFDEAVHLIDAFPIPSHWRRIRSVDFGFTNPFVCGWLAIDPDGRMFLYRYIYMSQRIVEDHAAQIVSLTGDEHIEATVADHDAEDRATLERHGVKTVPAQKAISAGVQEVQARLRVAGDGRARFFVMRGALVEADEVLRAQFKPVSIEEEFANYMWPKGADGKAVKEIPVDVDNHAMDMIRYGVMYANESPVQSFVLRAR